MEGSFAIRTEPRDMFRVMYVYLFSVVQVSGRMMFRSSQGKEEKWPRLSVRVVVRKEKREKNESRRDM